MSAFSWRKAAKPEAPVDILIAFSYIYRMKKGFFLLVFFFLNTVLWPADGIFPFFFGARSLSMGTGGMASASGINPVFINPALIGDFSGSISGYQYQNSYRDRNDFDDQLSGLLDTDLWNFNSLPDSSREDILTRIRQLNRTGTGYMGFSGHFPGLILGNYGIGGAIYTSGVINPVPSNRYDQPVSDVSQADINSLAFTFHGFSFTNYSLSYSVDVTYDLRIGANFNYINGKYIRRDFFINDAIFSSQKTRIDYLQEAWTEPTEILRTLNIDLGVSLSMGKYFRAAAVLKNLNQPRLLDEDEDSVLDRIVVAGIAFTPDNTWTISADLQLMKSRIFMSQEEIQPLSVGVEKGLFKNMMFLRLGFLGDIDDDHLVGENSNMLIGLGGGFRLGNFAVDVSAALDNRGTIGGLGVSGFALIR